METLLNSIPWDVLFLKNDVFQDRREVVQAGVCGLLYTFCTFSPFMSLRYYSEDEGSEEEGEEANDGDNDTSEHESDEESDEKEDELQRTCTASGDASMPTVTFQSYRRKNMCHTN